MFSAHILADDYPFSKHINSLGGEVLFHTAERYAAAACNKYYLNLSGYKSNCGIIVMSNLRVYTDNDTFKKEEWPIIIDTIKEMEYSCLQYTSSTEQDGMDELLELLGFRKDYSFFNVRSGNVVTVWSLIVLNKDDYEGEEDDDEDY